MERTYAKSPAEVANQHRQFLEELASGRLKSMSFGITQVDKIVNRVYPGRLLAIVARPSMMKTTLLTHLARVECQRIVQDVINDKYVLFVSLEESEGQVLCWISGELISPEGVGNDAMVAALNRAACWPCWIVGREPVPTLKDLTTENMPALTAQQVLREIQAVAQKTGKRPSLILLDYLQVLDLEGSYEQRNLKISDALQMLKKIAQHAGCPVVVAVQAKEEVDQLRIPIPRTGHSYYSSEVLHVSDVVMSLYYPWRNERCQQDGRVELPCGLYKLTPNLLWVQLLKQRHGEGVHGWPVWVDPVTRQIRGIYERDR